MPKMRVKIKTQLEMSKQLDKKYRHGKIKLAIIENKAIDKLNDEEISQKINNTNSTEIKIVIDNPVYTKEKYIPNLKQYVFIIKSSNNPDLIKRCLVLRANWKEAVNNYSTSYNFKWKENNKGIEYPLLINSMNNRKKVM